MCHNVAKIGYFNKVSSRQAQNHIQNIIMVTTGSNLRSLIVLLFHIGFTMTNFVFIKTDPPTSGHNEKGELK